MPSETLPSNDILILDGLEAIRKRPHMYVGELDENLPNKLVQEALCSSFYDGCRGVATEVQIYIDGSFFRIEDNGPGWSMTPQKDGRSKMEHIMTTLYACRDYKADGHKDLCNNGIVVVNAFSERATIRNDCPEGLYKQQYKRGVPLSSLQKVETAFYNSGIKLTFRLDPEILPYREIKMGPLVAWIRENKPKGLHVSITQTAEIPAE